MQADRLACYQLPVIRDPSSGGEGPGPRQEPTKVQVLVLGLDRATAMELDRCWGLEPLWESLLALAVDVCFICFLERLGMVVSESFHLGRLTGHA
ncbi:hypothetical protein [Synechococcus sp. UW140]|uniref:hypothetical protein n=1 Tax=Synechococcus sp. UW140 TaxID=368503 RepID=UPI000E0E1274|nr:hypothetical protein [Synechococcus sp. UW140]